MRSPANPDDTRLSGTRSVAAEGTFAPRMRCRVALAAALLGALLCLIQGLCPRRADAGVVGWEKPLDQPPLQSTKLDYLDSTARPLTTARPVRRTASRATWRTWWAATVPTASRANDDANKLWGVDGADTLLGHDGADKLYGNTGDNKLYGGAGADELERGPGDEWMFGGSGNDLLFGWMGSKLRLRRKGRRIGERAFRVGSGKTVTLRVKLAKVARRALARHGRLRLKVLAVTTDETTKAKVTTAKLTLRANTKRKA
jgi:RTX calcium-binding nonapeptide repeat (4 copies)